MRRFNTTLKISSVIEKTNFNWMANNLKQELINKISSTNDENHLLLLKADYDYFTDQTKDVKDELSTEDKSELINVVSEPFGKDTISQDELDEAIRKWRTK